MFTAQAAAANATASTWIPAPNTPAAVCIVDTGVDPNPDTMNVIARLAVDGGDPGDVDTVGHHGTLMSMIASAPYNGFGMVGAAPSVKVVSVRAKLPGENGLYFSDVLKGVQMCRQARGAFNIKVISLSLGGQQSLDQHTESLLQNTIDIARAAGVNVVAAAGNHPGPPDWPASYAPVLAVAASDRDGVRCAFSASGPAVDVSAPGCPQDVALPSGQPAWASGTSESTAFVSAVLAQLRALRSDLSSDEAERLLMASAASRDAGEVVDVDQAFRVAGLQSALAAGSAARPIISGLDAAATASSAAPGVADAREVPSVEAPARSLLPMRSAPTDVGGSIGRLPRPKVRTLRLRGHVLQLVLRGRPASVRTQVQPYVRRAGAPFPIAGRTLLMKGDRLRTRISGKLIQVSIKYVDPTGKRRPSAAQIVRP